MQAHEQLAFGRVALAELGGAIGAHVARPIAVAQRRRSSRSVVIVTVPVTLTKAYGGRSSSMHSAAIPLRANARPLIECARC